MTTVYPLYSGPGGAVTISGVQNVTVSDTYSVQPNDYIVTATGAGSFVITLLPAASYKTKNVIIKCLATASITVNAASGEFIDSASSRTLSNGEVLDIISDGVKWVDTVGSTISGAKLVDGTVTAAKLATNSVTTGKIADLNITTAKIADLNVTTGKIADSAISNSKLAADSVTADKIATGAVGTSEINTAAEPTVSTIYSNGWFRSYGNTGWYNQTHGGGIYMEDSTWVRTYNGKNFYSSGEIRADGGFNFLAPSGIPAIKANNAYILLRGAQSISSPYSVVLTSPSGAFATNWPSGWGGGLATWDIICASIQGNIVNTSDARIKEQVASISCATETIMKFRPVSFYWTKDYNSSLKNQQFGFIAQEVEKIMPELVIQGSYDDIKKQEGYKSLNYIGIIPFLTKAIQEQQQKIESLEERIKKLEDLINKGT